VAQVAAGLDEPGAGPSYSVRKLAHALEAAGLQAPLHCVYGWRGNPDDGVSPIPHRHRQDARHLPVLKSLCLSQELYTALRAEAAAAQVIHGHGLWLMPNVYPAWVCARAGLPLMISPRGMLGQAALDFSRWRKRAFWALFQNSAIRSSACLHATGLAEYEEIRTCGLRNPVAVIANGVAVPPLPGKGKSTAVRTLLTLGRVHPKKGLPHLVQAWARLEPRFPDWRLRIVGPDEVGHAAELATIAAKLELSRISIEGPLYGPAKTEAYQDADIFVLPTLNENFALTVAEALAAGTPVVATKGAPWSGLEERGCGWWVDVGAEPLVWALEKAMATPGPVLAEMGRAGRRWMQEDFSWDKVAADMAAVYRWLAGQGPPPDHVRFQ
jgi:glycosyltransferase involved in cell wall biosynthesis